jgi:hypothetical protein
MSRHFRVSLATALARVGMTGLFYRLRRNADIPSCSSAVRRVMSRSAIVRCRWICSSVAPSGVKPSLFALSALPLTEKQSGSDLDFSRFSRFSRYGERKRRYSQSLVAIC